MTPFLLSDNINDGDQMKIIKLKNDKYKIIFDDNTNIITYSDIIIKNKLLNKKQIDLDLKKRIEKETIFYNNYDRVYKFATKKVRCEQDVINFMSRLEIENIYQNKIIDKLFRLDLINDKKFASSYIHDRLSFSLDSINKIKNKLMNKNIDINVIEEALDDINIDCNERLRKIIIKKIKNNKKYSNIYLKQKIIRELTSQGYLVDDIIDIIDCNLLDDYEVLIKEYKYIYFKLKDKHSFEELEQRIKYYLLKRGFDYSRIKKEDLN